MVGNSAAPSTAIIHQASIEAEASLGERIVRALEEAAEPAPVAVGLFERGPGRCEIFAHYDGPPERQALLALIEQAGGNGSVSLTIEEIEPADWVTLSQAQRGPVSAGRFVVHGSHDRSKVKRRRHVLEIDAGQAFGTAHHASTHGCLLALDDHLKRHRPRLVIDIGTGTGILTIAVANALKLSVLASDSDPIAAAVARDNARKNGASALVSVLAARGFLHPSLWRAKADLVLANLLERALYDLAPELARHIRQGGTAILSGLTLTQARAIEARTLSHGFALKKRIILDGWATLVITRRSARIVRD